uniref:Protein binding protein n=1 Tax=Zea mays TaxID=4577 RepID=B6U5C9_MAIZE|nr:protein binding protein [Zea mays]
MASAGHRRHFADPHVLLKTQYNSSSRHVCDICRSKLAGLTGYRCSACDFDIHEACANYFKETISFFAHPWHTLTLSRMPSSCDGWSCDLCWEGCPPGDLVYRCTDCLFDVHPLCTMLPQTIRSPLHPRHDLRLVPSIGTCMCGCEELSVWNYVCSCPLKVNIACVSGAPSSGRQSTDYCGRSNTGSAHHASAATAQQPEAWHRRCSMFYRRPSVDCYYTMSSDPSRGAHLHLPFDSPPAAPLPSTIQFETR